MKTELQEIEVYYRSLKKTYLQTHVWKWQDKGKNIATLPRISPLPVN